ncbi:MarR family transcriptional regulator [Streptomyces sp. LP05-1]|uniref:MarR family transcriptional regulator n=1 Tax=Streptomyces pyxinae TaxID=2970734 RepID=A0ABT2CHS1_9ACTN|nr:MarR family transcriptional regulator [Streptomyces sp. LP05-1]MCS0636647.1 MarR family transcriptional regulator [Streptomyces sp. LP05-1]
MAEDVCAVAELLEVLLGRGQEAVPSGPVSPSQLRALLVLERHDGTNLRTLSDVLRSRNSSVSRLCDRLEAMGLVTRAPSPTSRREVELRLSRRGHTVLRELREARAREVAAVLARMKPAAVHALAEGLIAFRDAVEDLEDAEDRPGAGGHSVADSA